MEHERFFFALVNPITAFLFSFGFAFLRLRWPHYRHLTALSLAFLCMGVSFILHDFRILVGPGDVNIGSNVLFVATVLLACTSALERAELPYARMPLVLVALSGALPFLWFLFVEPSLTARILIVGAVFAAMTVITAARLIKQPGKTTADKLFATGVMVAFLITLIRPILALTGNLDINAEGNFARSDYWASIRAFTPLLSFAVATLFLAAIITDVITHLRGQADRDFLTGLLNRRGFESAGGDALARDLAEDRQPALLVADIDDFKKVNDTFGHKTGDAVIAGVARVLAHEGSSLLTARMGGEEFALYYNDKTRAELVERARDIRQALAAARFAGIPEDYPITVSVGIHVSYSREGLIDMLARADQALYRAKREGKDMAILTPVQLQLASRKAIGV